MTTLRKVLPITIISATFSEQDMGNLGCEYLPDSPQMSSKDSSFKLGHAPLKDKSLISAIKNLLANPQKIKLQDLQNIYKIITEHETPIKFTKILINQLSKDDITFKHFSSILSHLLIRFFNGITNTDHLSLLESLIDTINRKCPETYHHFMTQNHRPGQLDQLMKILFTHCTNDAYKLLKTQLIAFGIKQLSKPTIKDQQKEELLHKIDRAICYAEHNHYQFPKDIYQSLNTLGIDLSSKAPSIRTSANHDISARLTPPKISSQRPHEMQYQEAIPSGPQV